MTTNDLYCKYCKYQAKRKSDFKKHLQSKKHVKNAGSRSSEEIYICLCGNQYKHAASFSRHKKECGGDSGTNQDVINANTIIENQKEEIKDLKEMFIQMMDSNKEMQQIICDQNEKLVELANKPTTTVIKEQNNFNLDNFLNIECKDAMNLTDFIQSVRVTFEDLIYLGSHGFVKSIENTFIKELKSIEQTKRPIHCTDKKRKTLYVKDNDTWERDEDHGKMINAFDRMNRKQLLAMKAHTMQRDEDYLDDEKNLDQQNEIILSMCSYNKETSEIDNKKLIRDVSETTHIKK